MEGFKKHPITGATMAAEAGGKIVPGDELISIQGTKLNGADTWEVTVATIRSVIAREVGKPLKLVLQRNKQEQKLQDVIPPVSEAGVNRLTPLRGALTAVAPPIVVTPNPPPPLPPGMTYPLPPMPSVPTALPPAPQMLPPPPSAVVQQPTMSRLPPTTAPPPPGLPYAVILPPPPLPAPPAQKEVVLRALPLPPGMGGVPTPVVPYTGPPKASGDICDTCFEFTNDDTSANCSPACSEFLNQFRVLAWKNMRLRFRGWVVLLLEILIPVIIIIAIGGIKVSVGDTIYDEVNPSDYRQGSTLEELFFFNAPLCTDNNLVWSCLNKRATCLAGQSARAPAYATGKYLELTCQRRKIAVMPADAGNAAAVDAATNFIAYANAVAPTANAKGTFTLFKSEQEFIDVLTKQGYAVDTDLTKTPIYSAGLVFQAGYPNWEYTVRQNRTMSFNGRTTVNAPDTAKPSIDITVKNPSQTPSYAGLPYLQAYRANGMYVLMDAVNSFIAGQTACQTAGKGSCVDGSSLLKFVIQHEGVANFPSPKVSVSAFWNGVGFVFALLIIISLLLPLANVIKTLVEEKETRMREVMYMMALRSDALWLTWILHFMCLWVPLSIILTIASRQLFFYSNAGYIFIYFMVFFISTTAYGIFISTFFSKVRRTDRLTD